MKIWEFFENLDGLVYTCDMDTYEVLYMNQKARKDYGIHSLDDIRGKKCYQLLQGNGAPCKFCNNNKLRQGYFTKWQYFNPVISKQFSLHDTMLVDNGRRLRIEFAFIISTTIKRGEMLDHLETIASKGLRMALLEPSADKSIDIFLEYLGKSLKGDRAYIFERNDRGRDSNTYEWVACGITSEKEKLQDLPPELCANWYRKFHKSHNIVIKNIEDMREEDPLQYQNLKRQNITSIAVVPLYDGNRIIGFYGIDNPPVDSLEYASNMLEIVGYFISASLKRRDLLRQLTNMSYSDQLTHLGNRFAMNEYVAQLLPGESLGIVYCDLNDLKKINDTQSHSAGDLLIQRTSNILKKVFEGHGLFRIGGDEFLVLCPCINEKDLQSKYAMLKTELAEKRVNIAIGLSWQIYGAEDFDSLLLKAETQMYKDKANYYRFLNKTR